MIYGRGKEAVINRLERIEGQVRGIKKMIGEDRYCMEILVQTRAAAAAVKQVEMKVLEAHLNSCVRESFKRGDEGERREKIAEILSVFEKYSGG